MAAPVCISDERAMAVPVERLWKLCWDFPVVPKACAGFVDDVEVEGDGGPGTIFAMKINPAAEAGTIFKNRVVIRDNTSHVVKLQVLGAIGKVGSKLKSQLAEMKLEAVGDGSSVAKLKVEYEQLDGGGALAQKDEKEILDGYFSMIKMYEAYLIAHPEEYA